MNSIYCSKCDLKIFDIGAKCPNCGHQDKVNDTVGNSAIISMIIFIVIMICLAIVSCSENNYQNVTKLTPVPIIEKSTTQKEAKESKQNISPLTQDKNTKKITTKKMNKQVLISDYKTYINIDEKIKLEKINVAQTLDQPWGMDFIDSNILIITEKKGNLKLIDLNKKTSKNIKHEIPVVQSGQGGLLDIVYFDQFLYLSFTKIDKNLNLTTAIGRGKFIKPFNTLDDFQIIFEAKPYYADRIHFGSRIVIKNNYLYATIGERGQGIAAQKVDSHAGSIIRINLDGSVPDNPYSDIKGALPELYMIGLRNPQGMTISNDQILITNHGAMGGDFIGRVTSKGNFGWNEVGWGGQNYNGSDIGSGDAFTNKFALPILSWTPSIAPSNLKVYQGNEFPEWQGDILVCSLKFQMLILVTIEDEKPIEFKSLVKNKIGRIRDIEIDKEGKIYLITDANNSSLWKISLKQ